MAEAIAVLKLSPELAANVAKRVAPALSGLAQEAYESQRGVNGESFGISSVDGHKLDLKKTGTLEAKAIKYEAIGTKVRATVGSIRYARFHIKRGLLPRGGAALPAGWEGTIRRIADEETAKAVQGAR